VRSERAIEATVWCQMSKSVAVMLELVFAVTDGLTNFTYLLTYYIVDRMCYLLTLLLARLRCLSDDFGILQSIIT